VRLFCEKSAEPAQKLAAQLDLTFLQRVTLRLILHDRIFSVGLKRRNRSSWWGGTGRGSPWGDSDENGAPPELIREALGSEQPNEPTVNL